MFQNIHRLFDYVTIFLDSWRISFYSLYNELYVCFLVCDSSHWGVECSSECLCGSNVESCDAVLGCVACIDGWEGYNCVTDIDECTDTDDVCGDNQYCVNNDVNMYIILGE